MSGLNKLAKLGISNVEDNGIGDGDDQAKFLEDIQAFILEALELSTSLNSERFFLFPFFITFKDI